MPGASNSMRPSQRPHRGEIFRCAHACANRCESDGARGRQGREIITLIGRWQAAKRDTAGSAKIRYPVVATGRIIRRKDTQIKDARGAVGANTPRRCRGDDVSRVTLRDVTPRILLRSCAAIRGICLNAIRVRVSVSAAL